MKMSVIKKIDSSVTTTKSEAQPKLKLSTKTPAMDGPAKAPKAKVMVLNKNQKNVFLKSYQYNSIFRKTNIK